MHAQGPGYVFLNRLSFAHRVPVLTKLSCAILIALPAAAGEYAVLSSGLRIHVERHELVANMVRLYSTNDSFTELRADLVTKFEEDDYVPPPDPPPAANANVNTKAIATLATPDPKSLIHEAAIRSGLPPNFVESVAKVESAFRQDAVSKKGAVGVMQLMPETARLLAADPDDPSQNVDAGTRLLRELLIKYDGDVVKALAAYNAGSAAVDRYQGLPPYPETQTYVDKVIRQYQKSGGQ
jgi:soluble lytic murein transglycosylase-like protein